MTLTPLRALLKVGSVGRFVAGAQLGPEGLPLIQGATVTIALARPVPKKRLVVVAYSGTGAAIHTVPFLISHRKAVVALSQIGGGLAVLERPATGARDTEATAARATGASRARRVEASTPARAATSSAPTGDSGVYDEVVATMVSALAASGHDFGDHSQQTDAVVEALASTLADWKQDILDNEVAPGLKDDAAAEVAIHDLLEQARTDAAFEMRNVDISPEIEKLEAGIYNRAQQKCVQTPGFSLDSIRTILEDYRTMVLAGRINNQSWPDLLVCERFKMTFDSNIVTTFGGSDHGTHTSDYRIVMPIKPSTNGFQLTGQALGTYPVAQGQMQQDPQQCDANGTGTSISHDDELHGTGVTAQVPDFTLPSARINGPSPKLELLIGLPTETYHLYTTSDDPNCVGGRNENLPEWAGNFITSHRGEVDGTAATPNSYVFQLQPGTSATVESQSYDRTYSEGQNTENEHTTITILHTPGKFTPIH